MNAVRMRMPKATVLLETGNSLDMPRTVVERTARRDDLE